MMNQNQQSASFIYSYTMYKKIFTLFVDTATSLWVDRKDSLIETALISVEHLRDGPFSKYCFQSQGLANIEWS